ncbi:hypothetical protein AB9M62_27775 [Bacillales bacterium AN1005]|uniref:hypothetical protein n=1 Tax=Niallia taxi TaxID=2499688 RepID=UPI0021A5D838|nr:hypothetical protein [Niallia taxi]MCT2345067.1 hypothetical protein [Niallia taxi]
MNKVKKKLLSLVIVLTFMSSMSVSTVFAAETANNVHPLDSKIIEIDLSNKQQKEIEKFRNDVVEDLQDLNNPSTEKVHNIIKKETNPVENLIDSNVDINVDSENQRVNLIHAGSDLEEQTYSLNDNIDITFTNDNSIIIDELSETKEKVETDPDVLEELKEESDNLLSMSWLPFIDKANAATSKSKDVSYTATYIDWSGAKIFSCYISAKFTYNGSKVTAVRTGNAVKRYFMGMLYSTYSHSSAISKPSKKERIAYQQATASWGANVKGVGVVWDETYLRANISCNQNGVIKKSKKII